MNKVIEASVSHPAQKEGRVNGVVDLPSPTRISGWAIDRADPNAHVDVDVYFEGKLIGRVAASDHRKDLERNGIGTGNYGFKFDLAHQIEPEMSFAIQAIARTKDGVSADLRNTGRAAHSEYPALRLSERALLVCCSMRQDLAELSRKIDDQTAQGVGEDSTSEILERIELVQARLETAFARENTPQPSPVSVGLKFAVIVSLLIGVSSLALGIASFWAG